MCHNGFRTLGISSVTILFETSVLTVQIDPDQHENPIQNVVLNKMQCHISYKSNPCCSNLYFFNGVKKLKALLLLMQTITNNGPYCHVLKPTVFLNQPTVCVMF